MRIFFLILIAFFFVEGTLIAAEAGMPQLDPKYWASQAFWLILVFSLLYLSISKFFIPKIKNGLDDRENKIKDDLDEAKNLKENVEKKLKDYEELIANTKKDVQKILNESKKKLNTDIQNKRKSIEKEIDDELEKAQSEIVKLKTNSLKDIEKISEALAGKIVEEITGDKLNESNVRAVVSDNSKKNLSKFI